MDVELLGENVPRQFDVYDKTVGVFLALIVAWTTTGLPYFLSLHVERITTAVVKAELENHAKRPHSISQDHIQAIQIQQSVMANQILNIKETVTDSNNKLDRLLQR